MSETKFTPGPWDARCLSADAEPNSFGWFVLDAKSGNSVLNYMLEGPLAAVYSGEEDASECAETKANAYLMAAAPDLYEALMWVRANYASGPTSEINARIDAALAKAVKP